MLAKGWNKEYARGCNERCTAYKTKDDFIDDNDLYFYSKVQRMNAIASAIQRKYNQPKYSHSQVNNSNLIEEIENFLFLTERRINHV